MKLRKKFFVNLGLGILVSSLIVALSGQGYLKRMEAAGSDLLFRLRGFSDYNPNIVLIEITDEDLAVVGRWPWDRVWHAALTKALKDLGAGIVYFDMIFTEPSPTPESDIVFAEAIEYADSVYLPFAYQEKNIRRDAALYPIDVLYSHVAGTGSINIYPDIDGTIRKMPLFFKDDSGNVMPHIALKIAMDYGDYEIADIFPRSLVLSSDKKNITVSLTNSKDNNIVINWRGKWKDTFTHFSYLEIIANYKKFLEGEQLDIDIRPLKDSICLVAVTAIGLYDIRPTPIEAEYPGVGAIATVVSSLLDGTMLTLAKPEVNFTLIYVLGILPFLFVTGEKSLREILSVALVASIFIFITVKLFERNYLINYMLGLLSLFASYMIAATYQFVRVSVEKQKFFHMAVTDGLTELANIRYFMMILNAEYSLAKRDPEERGFCVIMMDIDHFKVFNDTYGHAVGDFVLKGVANVLKTSVRTSDIVARYGGEEMVVLLRMTAVKDAMKVAEKIRRNLEGFDFNDGENHYKVTISLGVSQFSGANDTVETLMKRADAGLYVAKENGRNRVSTMETIPK